ncbi:hypothetical protein CVT24_009786 [Panaeolus cyanescens]|uniref:2,5-diamino-6-ribosylamino-4(3H)-pyrimidinone 5'-phosphate reductase n=1 Tax=Panaeolus cyanescens TaxID=181874 RepID=A0A409VAE4_9AGAR|nr:hypothetical protein CVT24_009786 [Panaeolus cyanescens]
MGLVQSAVSEAFPPKSTFKVEDIPDLTGKVLERKQRRWRDGLIQALLNHNAKVYLAARSKEKAEEAIAELKKETGKEGIWLQLDLADLNSVKAAAQEFASQEKELHVLFNNAGVMVPPIDMVTAQGYDLQFGTNVLGHFYFTKLLLPQLLAGAKSSPDGKARVVNTSSSASLYALGLDFNTFKDGKARKKKGTSLLYAQSKLGNILYSNTLARKYGDQGIVSTSVNPGNLKTDLARHLPKFVSAVMNAVLLYPAPYGALTQLYAGTMPQGAELNGKYLIPWARIGTRPNSVSNDEKLQEELWKWLEEQVAVKFVMNQPPSLLSNALSTYTTVDPPLDRPHVTLTFAQSLDAKIAGAEGRQLILSGKESMIMTHWMRTMHDAILVGIGTALNDDPQLNVRHLPPPDATAPRHHLPRPIIVDSQLRLNPNCKLLNNFNDGTGRRPYIVTAPLPPGAIEQHSFLQRKKVLEQAGARVFHVHPSPISGNPGVAHSHRLTVPSILKVLRDLGITSLMVEGGAKIISSFLAESESLVDTLIVTIAPTFIGDAGVGYSYTQTSDAGSLQMTETQSMGKDVVVVMKKVY